MKTYNFFTNNIETLKEKKADFLLLLDAPYKISSIDELIKKEEKLFSPLLITNAIKNLSAFSEFTLYNLEQKILKKPDNKEIFVKGMAFGESYELRGNSLVLAQFTKDVQKNIDKTYALLQDTKSHLSTFEKLLCDKTLIFAAGFLLEASRRFHIVVGGGAEMALVLFIADTLRGDVLMRVKSENITFVTTSWAVKDEKILEILNKLSYKVNALYSECNLENAEIQKVKSIAFETEKDLAGAGSAVAFGVVNAITNEALLNEMELIVYLS